MALHWNVADVKDEKTCWYKTGEKDEDGKDIEKMNAVTNSLIWATMSVGVSEITEKNWKEFFVRLKAVEAVFGPSVSKDGKSMITEKVIFDHIGLYTNASKITTTEFFKNLAKDVSTPKKEDA
jgi:hypothetical protein